MRNNYRILYHPFLLSVCLSAGRGGWEVCPPDPNVNPRWAVLRSESEPQRSKSPEAGRSMFGVGETVKQGGGRGMGIGQARSQGPLRSSSHFPPDFLDFSSARQATPPPSPSASGVPFAPLPPSLSPRRQSQWSQGVRGRADGRR